MAARSGRSLDFVNFASNPYSFELKANFELFQLPDFSVLERPEQQPKNLFNQNSSEIEKKNYDFSIKVMGFTCNLSKVDA